MPPAATMHPSIDALNDFRDAADVTDPDASVAAHVAACDDCQHTLAFLRALKCATAARSCCLTPL